MFENQPQGAAPPSAPKEPADMFADIPAMPPSGGGASPSPLQSAPPPVIGTESPEVSGPIFSKGKMWTTIGVGILVLALVGGGVWWFWWKPRQAAPEGTSGGTTTSPAPTEIATTPEPTLPPPAPIDQDADGLSDTDEAARGTNPTLADTDGDGLFDREEVQVYGTDPLKADTDGDTYLDGVEVKNGYNPKGPGKLMNEQEDMKKLQQP